MGHPIQYGPHASHLWENQSAFQVLFHYLQICDIIFFSINKKIIPGLVALYNENKSKWIYAILSRHSRIKLEAI